MDSRSPACEWTCEHVRKWLQHHNLSIYERLLCEMHAVDGTALLLLTEKDLREAAAVSGDRVVLGDLKRLLFAVQRLRTSTKCEEDTHRLPRSMCIVNATQRRKRSRRSVASPNRRRLASFSSSDGDADTKGVHLESKKCKQNSVLALRHQPELKHWPSHTGGPSAAATAAASEAELEGQTKKYLTNVGGMSQREREWIPEPEYTKAAVSFVYVFAVIALTALVMVIVHERLPDMSKYPPLPDLLLDNLPETWWAFQACELCGAALFAIFVATVVCHKHRFIVLRRAFALTGTIFLLRSVTMLVTSLSVPQVRSACRPMPHADWPSRFERALAIWSAFGMRIRGVETCGDYMFSGHTSILTILNHFITEYTPLSYYRLHTLCWMLNLFGAFFILLSHEHYTLDVFAAFWLSSRLFLYYHTLANNAVSLRRDRHRTRVWFPLFNYFEACSAGAVPNEFEWPFNRELLHRAISLACGVATQVFCFAKAVITSTQPHGPSARPSEADMTIYGHEHAD